MCASREDAGPVKRVKWTACRRPSCRVKSFMDTGYCYPHWQCEQFGCLLDPECEFIPTREMKWCPDHSVPVPPREPKATITPEARRARAILLKYGLTPEAHGAMLQRQGGVCAICKRPPSDRGLFVDHDHDTGTVRGLLCPACNTALGLLGDNLAGLLSAVSYLGGEVDHSRVLSVGHSYQH